MRPATPIDVTAEERSILENTARSLTSEQRMALLPASGGFQNPPTSISAARQAVMPE